MPLCHSVLWWHSARCSLGSVGLQAQRHGSWASHSLVRAVQVALPGAGLSAALCWWRQPRSGVGQHFLQLPANQDPDQQQVTCVSRGVGGSPFHLLLQPQRNVVIFKMKLLTAGGLVSFSHPTLVDPVMWLESTGWECRLIGFHLIFPDDRNQWVASRIVQDVSVKSEFYYT